MILSPVYCNESWVTHGVRSDIFVRHFIDADGDEIQAKLAVFRLWDLRTTIPNIDRFPIICGNSADTFQGIVAPDRYSVCWDCSARADSARALLIPLRENVAWREAIEVFQKHQGFRADQDIASWYPRKKIS